MPRQGSRFLILQQFGLVFVILALCIALSLLSGTRVDHQTGRTINMFLNADTLMQIATETSFFAIMAAGATLVIVSAGIDLSVGATYALVGVATALVLKSLHAEGLAALGIGTAVALTVGGLCGLANGLMVSRLGVHPFIITLGSMWIYRGLAFVASKGDSLNVPESLVGAAKSSLLLPGTSKPVPLVAMLLVCVALAVYLKRTVPGRQIVAVGGNPIASEYSGISVQRVLVGVYALCGLTAGIAALLGCSYYGAASSIDGQGYELYVIASCVVGGVSLTGGSGSPFGAMLGALLIVLIRQSIRLLNFEANYEWIIVGIAIIVAVLLDKTSQKMSVRRAAGSRT